MLTIKGSSVNERVIEKLLVLGFDEELVRKLRVEFLGKNYLNDSDLVQDISLRFGSNLDKSFVTTVTKLSRRFSLFRIFWFVRDFFFPPSSFVPSLTGFILISPVVLMLRIRLRLYLALFLNYFFGNRLRYVKNENVGGFDHNFKQLGHFSIGHRQRTERLICAMKCIGGGNPYNAKLLAVGPRNEAEIMLLRAHGYAHVTSIDLFTYSPWIKEMDMDHLEFPDDHFDVYYSSAVIKYSSDIKQTISEAIRVTKNGGLMVFGFTYGSQSSLVFDDANLLGGANELLKFFDKHVAHVYFNDDFYLSKGDSRVGLIFSLAK